MNAGATPAKTVDGGCLCGSVRFSAVPAKRHFDACHCSMCRRWSAGPALMVDCTDSVEFTKSDGLARYRSSDWAERLFCNQCGSPLAYRLVEAGTMFVSLETLDDRAGFSFTNEIFIDEKPAYYDFANATKKMTGSEVMAAFEASQAKG